MTASPLKVTEATDEANEDVELMLEGGLRKATETFLLPRVDRTSLMREDSLSASSSEGVRTNSAERVAMVFRVWSCKE